MCCRETLKERLKARRKSQLNVTNGKQGEDSEIEVVCAFLVHSDRLALWVWAWAYCRGH